MKMLKLIKDYDLAIEYHPGKANVVADALSRKTSTFLVSATSSYRFQLVALRDMDVKFKIEPKGVLLATFVVRPSLLEHIQKSQRTDKELMKEIQRLEKGEPRGFGLCSDGILVFQGRVCIPRDVGLISAILEEPHSSAYAIHPDNTKMYRTIRENYWWSGMMREIAEFVGRCLVCQQVKAEHQQPAGL
ncbi:uncharacterized protein LOC120270302 [Dioscorea cayenensis subsp. rotundata]|uniref:Uncharacterized protein LOC120270302 n=1 Tax=Dioscorea cayennensis subsp. rotundata TaxID=55577 RepID=A0AB40C0K7_DIOCR|nr:uncharacterized protein LOC120270302 [Dioscorea cayenensis subsp. rotundata]